MKLFLTVLAVVAIVPYAGATDYFVAKTGSDSNNCTAAQSQSTPKLTITSAAACTSGTVPDTIFVGAGTYAESLTTLKSFTRVEAIANDLVTIRPSPGTARVVHITGETNVTIWNLDLDGSNGGSGYNITSDNIKLDVGSHNFTVGGTKLGSTYRCRVRMGFNMGVSIQGVSNNATVTGCEIVNNGLLIDSPFAHGIYMQKGDGHVISYNWIHGNACNGMQIYSASSPGATNAHVHHNIFADNARVGTCGTQLVAGSTGHIIERNEFYNDVETGNTTGLLVNFLSPANTIIRNNTFYNAGINRCIRLEPSASSITIQNNILLSCGTAISDAGTGTVTTTNLTSGTPSAVFVSVTPGAYDLSLKTGSAAINNGTNVGSAFCGSSPDQGAFERPEITAASINGNTLDVTVCSISPPILPLGTWTPACTGTGCGTPSTGSVSVTGGGLVRIAVNGIGGGACAVGQTWTISASGSNTDSALVGNQFNQTVKSETNFAVNSSACTGSGGSSFPSGAVALYEFENNINDSSGNGNHAVGSANISYAAAKHNQGLQLTANADSYVDTGLLNGHNPSTTHLVVAFGIRISTLNDRRVVAGVTIGTNQRFYIRIDSDNIWGFATQSVISPVNTEFPVVTGDTHVCVKFNPTTDTATLYINGMAGAIAGASVQSYTSYTFPSTLIFGNPTSFGTVLSGNDIIDQALIYTTDVSCTDIYNAWEPSTSSPTVDQVAHRWQAVYLVGGSPATIGADNSTVNVIKGGAVAVIAQMDCTGGDCGSIQPRFRYNINGGAFNNVVPDFPTADGISYWGSDTSPVLNGGIAGGPLVAGLTHTDGIHLLTSAAIPTIAMADNTSYTLGGIFRTGAAIGDTVCFKIYDQNGQPLASYTPSAGSCVTVIHPQAAGGY